MENKGPCQAPLIWPNSNGTVPNFILNSNCFVIASYPCSAWMMCVRSFSYAIMPHMVRVKKNYNLSICHVVDYWQYILLLSPTWPPDTTFNHLQSNYDLTIDWAGKQHLHFLQCLLFKLFISINRQDMYVLCMGWAMWPEACRSLT